VSGGAAFGADSTLEQPAAVSNTVTMTSVITALTLVDCSTGVRATANSPVVYKCFIVDSSWSAYYRGSVCR
jgi:hypothetical protein